MTKTGGPGGSGIQIVLRDGDEISTIVNPNTTSLFNSEEKYFDIISWDPRGVNNTTPHLNCFPSSFSQDVWRYQAEADGIDFNSSTAISNIWARSKTIAARCSSNNEIASHMNTPPVVRDMVEIIELHGEWREMEAKRLLADKKHQSLDLRAEHRDIYSSEAVIERTRWRQGEENLNYWGFSYGTLLGATFAALQPYRVGRIILDGVVDSTDYYRTTWLRNLQDTDAIMSKFYQYCTSAGPSNCSLAQTDSTPSSIEIALESLLIGLKEEPIAVSATATRGAEIITYSDVMNNIRPALYTPFASFTTMADLLSDLIYGNGSAFADSKQKSHEPRCPLQNQRDEALKEKCQVETGPEATRGILCSDGLDLNHFTKADLKNIIGVMKKQSKWLGENWAKIPLSCIHWKGKAKWKVTGGMHAFILCRHQTWAVD
jgi:pimeloyl-ACP methyl ester carboxylesterase